MRMFGRHLVTKFFSPPIQLENLVDLFLREVIDDAEILTHLLRRHVLDALRDGLAAVLEEQLDAEEVGSVDEVGEVGLAEVEELLFEGRERLDVEDLALLLVLAVVLAPLHDLSQGRGIDLGDGDREVALLFGQGLHHVLHDLGEAGRFAADGDLDTVLAVESKKAHFGR